ncbi:hypothetical protein DO97_10885 [Neosynechococcus sphagnicola sy1]|uniref:Uncharacterized protein n=1 Tax=Neosynechococcus sphagnicola sy1 TaxID=1497020 RepID=A0A098TJE7_9CYAN|nr:hypothetical protein [Neosynechococcus sphagnicola]KGF72254.1 hypothetical protein DO97_10885 [Neosynechococcus sphagnicola sy1]
MAKKWQEITLGEIWQSGTVKFRQMRRHLKAYSPVKLDLQAAQRLWGVVAPAIMAPLLYVLEGWKTEKLLSPLPEVEPEAVALVEQPKHKPWYKRTELVEQVLKQAWELGYRTYSQLMAQVKQLTGKGCSKRAIARFVKERKASIIGSEV